MLKNFSSISTVRIIHSNTTSFSLSFTPSQRWESTAMLMTLLFLPIPPLPPGAHRPPNHLVHILVAHSRPSLVSARHPLDQRGWRSSPSTSSSARGSRKYIGWGSSPSSSLSSEAYRLRRGTPPPNLKSCFDYCCSSRSLELR